MKKYILLSAFLILNSTFSIPNCFGQYTKLLDFDVTNGSTPYGDLISDGTFLYGMTSAGGTYNKGLIFKINPDGTGYDTLINFSGVNGSSPWGSLISDGTFLYGMTSAGGTNNRGLIFKIMPDGTGYSKLLDFSGATNGSQPIGSLISDGIFLCGMTLYGGTSDDGVVFKIKPDGTGYSKLLDFSGTNGKNPHGYLISDGTSLYGMTQAGGVNNYGVIFKIKPDGSGYSKLLDFAGTSNGSSPMGSLILDGTYLFGMTYYGGINNKGVIFKIKPNGMGYANLHDFGSGTDGRSPNGSLISDGTFLYGVTTFGGSAMSGTILKIKPDGTGYSSFFSLSGGTNSNIPRGSLISDGTFLYGMTQGGGTNYKGTVFEFGLAGAAAITGNTAVCVGQSTTLTASGGITYSWSIGETSTSIVVSPTIATTYSVTAVAGTYTATASVTVKMASSITALISAPPFVCSGSTETLTASGGATYLWNTGDTNASIIISPTTATVYTATVSAGNCPPANATTTVSVTQSPIASISGNTAICLGNSTTLTASGGTMYSWSTWSMDSAETSISVSPSTTTTYSVVVYDVGSCSDTAFATVTVNNPNAGLTLKQDTINPLLWYVHPAISGTAPFTYLWDFGDGNTSTLSSPSHTYSVAAHYAICLTVTDANGCSSSTCNSTYKMAASGIIQYLNVVNTTGIESLQSTNEINVYPNPTVGKLNVAISQSADLKMNSIEIYNVYGECVHSQIATSSNCQVDLSDAPNGVYFLQLSTEKGIARKKIVISH